MPRRVFERSLYVDPRRLAVIVIDMQEGFLNVLPKEKSQSLVDTTRRLIRYCAIDDIPVAVVEYDYSKHDMSSKGMTHVKLQEELLRVKRKKLVYKSGEDAFTNSNQELHKFLTYHSIMRVCVAGLYAEKCVNATVATGNKWKYRMFTSEDLIAVQGRLFPTCHQEQTEKETYRRLSYISTVYQNLDQLVLCEFAR